jgi:prepilin peptidase CpaA
VILSVVGVASGLAAVIDLRTGRIPNVLTASVAAAGLGLAAAGVTGHSMAGAALGMAVGGLLLLPGHVLGGTGAGDVKLMAALGTLLGPTGALMAVFYTAIAGGFLAVGHALHRRRLSTTLARTAAIVAAPADARAAIEHSASGSRFAYGPAIAVGAVAAALFLK